MLVLVFRVLFFVVAVLIFVRFVLDIVVVVVVTAGIFGSCGLWWLSGSGLAFLLGLLLVVLVLGEFVVGVSLRLGSVRHGYSLESSRGFGVSPMTCLRMYLFKPFHLCEIFFLDEPNVETR